MMTTNIITGILLCSLNAGLAVYLYGERSYGIAGFNIAAAVLCGLNAIILAIQSVS